MPTITDGSWLILSDALTQVGIGEDDSDDVGLVDRARLAAAAFVERQRPDLLTVVDDVATYVPDPDVYEGSLLLVARLHARKGSPTGLASYGEFGPAAVVRFDPDVERLLGIGRYAPPRIG